MSKFSTYLTEQGFYFANISNPNKTLFGADIVQPTKKKKEVDEKDVEKESKAKGVTTNSKIAKYLQIVNSIQ